jgi:hypothetical protein
VVFSQGRRHSRRRERLRKAGNLSEVPRLLVDRVSRRRSEQVIRQSLLHWRLARNVGVCIHNVVWVYEAHHHEKGLAFPVQCQSVHAQPANRFAGIIAIDLISLIRRTEFVTVKIEEIESIRLQRRMIVDGGVGLEQLLIQFELAKVGGGVAQPLQRRAHIGPISPETRNIACFHLIEDAVDLRWRAADERGSRRRAHCRCDVVIAKIKASAPQLGAGRQLEIAGHQQVICFLVGDDENNVVRGAWPHCQLLETVPMRTAQRIGKRESIT